MNKQLPNPRRQAFTAIELMIVLVVALILAGMAIPTVFSSIRKARTQEAAAQILQVASRARVLAINDAGHSDNGIYGIRIHQDSNAATISLLYGPPAAGSHSARIWQEAGKSVTEFTLGSQVDIWVGKDRLTQTDQKEIAWYYKSGSGLPVSIDADQVSLNPVGIGTVRLLDHKDVWGLKDADHDDFVDDQTIAPAIPSDKQGQDPIPGLSIRSRDGAVRYALTVRRTGQAGIKEF